ncbi:MAG: serine/threonine protein kinase [Sarcina sp.]
MENLVGLIIENKYQLIEAVGKGGMGAVYLAKDLKLNTYWAVKVIKKTQDGIDLLAEPNILKILKHAMLPRITDISESSLYFFIIMDFIDGRTLESIAKERGKIKEEVVINWAKQICNALDYLHNLKPNPIIYRDMKPENIMLTKEGNIKIIDFGIAREFKFDASEDTNYLGTRGYAAPEQYRINNSQTDRRTDIYGLGVTMYRLLTNKTPDEPPYEIKPVREFDFKLSEGIEHIVMKSTALDPDLRYTNVRELLHDLDNVKMIGSKFRRKNRMRRLKIIFTIFAMVLSIGTIAKGVESYNSAIFDNYKKKIYSGIAQMTSGSVALSISGVICYTYLKEGVKIKKNKMDMKAARKSMYRKNEMNISKHEIKSFNYDTDYLEEIISNSEDDTQILDNFNKDDNDTDFLIF